ncbi:MAG TPA: DUF2007 domain-containing protein [Candidatus Cybelea sp.]|nr:DUF2007 domain-containing protein [Candidatus Cybelea sp.]
MVELLRTNDAVLLSFATALLAEAEIETFVFDQNISIVEGSIAAFPRRLMVSAGDAERARRLLAEAGVAASA